MTDWKNWIHYEIAGNELWRIAALFLLILGSFVAGKITRVVLLKIGDTQKNRGRAVLASFYVALSRVCVVLLVLLAVYLGAALLVMNEQLFAMVQTALRVMVTISVVYVAYCMVDVAAASMTHLASKTSNTFDDMLVPLVRKSLRVTIVILGMVQIAQILSGKSISSIVAALGVGSLAIALAAKDTVSNFFGSLVIFTDRPFKIGDRIVVDGKDGIIEEVGLRSTRFRTLDGHLVIIPNGELANKTITNISDRPYIKHVANITITYDTSPEKVTAAKTILEEILKNHEGMREDFPPRIYFNQFNDWALNLLVIYWYHPADYWAYCACAEKVNLEILKRFNDAGIDFAFPSQTAYLAGDPERPLNVGLLKNVISRENA
ncbi:MAG: mechanosensitive ion channel family protein [Spartobacteria bacterium]|nr:mechanosensitive ion channel family protein [Spartobacteria bacterium]